MTAVAVATDETTNVSVPVPVSVSVVAAVSPVIIALTPKIKTNTCSFAHWQSHYSPSDATMEQYRVQRDLVSFVRSNRFATEAAINVSRK